MHAMHHDDAVAADEERPRVHPGSGDLVLTTFSPRLRRSEPRPPVRGPRR